MSKRIEVMWLSCGCAADVLDVDKGIRAVAGLEKIIRFDIKDKSNVFIYV